MGNGEKSMLFLNQEVRRDYYIDPFFCQICIEVNDTDFQDLIDGDGEGKLGPDYPLS